MAAMTKLNKIDEIKKTFILFWRFSTSCSESENSLLNQWGSDVQTKTDRPDNHHDTFILEIANLVTIWWNYLLG